MNKFLAGLVSTRRRKVLVVLLVCLAAVAVLGRFILRSGPVKRAILRKADALLQEKVHLSLKVGDLRYSLVRLSVELKDIQLQAVSLDASPLRGFSADRVYVNLGRRTLFPGGIHIQQLQVERPHLVVVQGPKKEAEPKAGPTKPLRVRIDKFDLEQGKLDLNDKTYPFHGALENILASLRFLPQEGKHHGQVQANSGRIVLAQSVVPIEELGLGVRFDSERIDIDKLLLKSRSSVLEAQGWVQDYQGLPRFFLQIRSTLELAEMLPLVDRGQDYRGNLIITVSAQGEESHSALEGAVSGRNLTVRGLPCSEFEVEFNATTDALEVNRFSASLVGGRLEGRARISPDPDGKNALALDWKGLDLAQITSSLSRSPLVPASKTEGSFHAQWTGRDFLTLEGKGLVLLASTAKGEERGRPSAALDGRISLIASPGKIEVLPSRLRLENNTLEFSAELDKKRSIKADFSLKAADLSATQKLLFEVAESLHMPVPQRLSSLRTEGHATATGSVRGPLQSLRAELDIQGADLALEEIIMPFFRLQASYAQNIVSLTELSLALEEGRADVSGFVSFDPKNKFFGRKAELLVRLKDIELGLFARSFPIDHEVSGKLGADAVLSGSLSDPLITFNLALKDLVLDGEDISSVSLEGSFQQNSARMDAIQMVKGDGVLAGFMRVDLARRTYAGQITAEKFDLGDFNSIKSLPGPVRGLVNGRFEGKGSLDAPDFSLRLTAEDLELQSLELGTLTIEADADGRRLESHLNLPEGKANFRITARLERPYIIEGTFSVTDFRLENILVPGGPEDRLALDSTLTGSGSFLLPLDAIESLRLNLKVDKINAVYQELWLQNNRPLKISFDSGILRVEDFQLIGTGTELKLAGRLPLSVDEGGQLDIHGSMNLKLLEPFLSPSLVEGFASLSGTVRGSLMQPKVNMEFELNQGAWSHPQILRRFHDMTVQVHLDEQLLELKKFAVRAGEGRVEARGTLPLSSLPLALVQRTRSEEGAAEADLEINVSGMELGGWVQNAQARFVQDFGGLVEGRVHIRGRFHDLSQIAAEGRLDRLELSLEPLFLTNPKPITFHLKDGLVNLEEAQLAGERMSLQLGGRVQLSPEPTLDVRMNADIDSAVLTPLFPDITMGGAVTTRLEATGPATNPVLKGEVALEDGFFQLTKFAVWAEAVSGVLEFADSTVKLRSLQGVLNGGPFQVFGNLRYHGVQVEKAQFVLSADSVQLTYPEGLSGRAQASLLLKGEEAGWRLSGDIRVLQAFFNRDIELGTEFLRSIRSPRPRRRVTGPPFLESVSLDVRTSTVDAFVVDNNLANLEMTGNLHVSGTAFRPILSGRVTNRFPGQAVFGLNDYQVETARADFLGTELVDPNLNIVAHTQVTHEYDNLDVTLNLSGLLSELSFSLTSSPPRSQEEIASLLITGYGLNRVKTQSTNILSDQLLLFFTNPLASPLTDRLKRILGAEEVYVEPINIATEEDPGARFTFKKRVTNAADIIYSIDVSNTQKQTWMMDYRLARNFVIRSFRKDDGSYGSSIRHRFGFDLGSPAEVREEPVLSEKLILSRVEFEGETDLPLTALKEKTKMLKTGSKFNYSNLRAAADSLLNFYKQRGYLGAIISPVLRYEEKDVLVTFRISTGDPMTVVFRGDPVPNKLKKKILASWTGRLPDDMALAEARTAILNHLHGRGYYEAIVTLETMDQEGQKTFVLDVESRSRYRIRQFLVQGNRGVSSALIKKTAKRTPSPKVRGLWTLIYDFRPVERALLELYEDHGFMKAQVQPLTITAQRDRRVLDIILTMEEGEQSRVRVVRIEGNQAASEEKLRRGLSLTKGTVYRATALSSDRSHLLSLYRSLGYMEVSVDSTVVVEADGRDVAIQHTVVEGPRHTIAAIALRGNFRTPDIFLLRELNFKVGEPLNLAKLTASQKGLYDTQVFQSVSIYSEPLEPQGTQERVVVEVEEQKMFQVAYGLRYSSEEKLEGFGELGLTNLLGRGRNAVMYYRQSSSIKDFRFSLKEPYLFGQKFNTLYSIYFNQETMTSFVADTLGFSLQQQVDLPMSVSLSYLYSLSNVHTYELEQIGPFPFDISVFLSEVSAFLVRDTRNQKLDAQRGSFASLSLTYSPDFLGSDLTYVSFFGQYSRYTPLLPNLIWASNFRVGLADAFSQVLIPSKRFYAGGGNSVRGFERDMVGPLDSFFRSPEGGESLFILNQELRFPVYKWLRAVVFYDAGNVYPNLGDFDPFNLRHSLGVGLRLNTPIALIRLDYGRNLFPQADEPRGVFFLSIGQAF